MENEHIKITHFSMTMASMSPGVFRWKAIYEEFHFDGI